MTNERTQQPQRLAARHVARRRQQGFSLIEIMIVITLIGLIGTFAMTNYMKSREEGYVRGAKIMMKQLQSALDDYYRICSGFPTNAAGGLDALVNGPSDGSCKDYGPSNAILKKVPKDPWGSDFFYLSEDGRKYVLRSLGADKKEGGSGNDKDISTEDPDF